MPGHRFSGLRDSAIVKLVRQSQLLSAERPALLLGVLAVVSYTAAQISIPLAISYALDSLSAHAETPFRLALLALLVACGVNAVASTAENIVVFSTTQQAIYRFRRALFSHLHVVNLQFFSRHSSGQILSRFHSDLAVLEEFLLCWSNALSNVLMIAGVFAAIAWTSAPIALAVAAAVIALGVVNSLWAPISARHFQSSQAALGEMNAAVTDNLLGVQAVQDCRREQHNLSGFKSVTDHAARLLVRAAAFSQARTVFVDTTTGLCTGAVVLIGGLAAANHGFRVGALVGFVLLVRRLFEPIRSLSLQVGLVQRAMASGERIREVLDAPAAILPSPAAPSARLTGRSGGVRFENVSFGYAADTPVLKSLSFEAAERSTVAIVGVTGAGKTTIASLMVGFYEPWSGSVTIDGVNVRDLSRSELAQKVSLVLQEPILFTGTVRDNILCGRDLSPLAAEHAAALVHAQDFILRLPDSFDTMLSPDTTLLSLGQRQLISFARALVTDPQVLILDEATANIDSFTEREIQRGLRQLLADRTCIIIAHRLTTVRAAHEILVIDDGAVAERGDHQTLMRSGRLYRKFAQQALDSASPGGRRSLATAAA